MYTNGSYLNCYLKKLLNFRFYKIGNLNRSWGPCDQSSSTTVWRLVQPFPSHLWRPTLFYRFHTRKQISTCLHMKNLILLTPIVSAQITYANECRSYYEEGQPKTLSSENLVWTSCCFKSNAILWLKRRSKLLLPKTKRKV